MRHAVEPRVEAHLPHLVGARQEEVDHAIGDHAAREARELVVEAALLAEAVAEARRTRVHAQHLPVGGGEARDLPHRAAHQVQGGSLQHVHQPLQSRPRCEDEVVVHPQHVLGGHLGHREVPACEPALAERHEIVLYVRAADALWLVTVVCDDHGDRRVEAADAGDECPQAVVTQKGLCGNGDQGADVVLIWEFRGAELGSDKEGGE